jgi:hypothetical protein
MTWNVAVETGGFLVSKKVQIEIETGAQPAAVVADLRRLFIGLRPKPSGAQAVFSVACQGTPVR